MTYIPSGENDADEARLGSWMDENGANFALWAPTAQKVELHLYDKAKAPLSGSPYTLQLDTSTGIWHFQGEASLKKCVLPLPSNRHSPSNRPD